MDHDMQVVVILLILSFIGLVIWLIRAFSKASQERLRYHREMTKALRKNLRENR